MKYERLSLTGFINEMKDVTEGPHPRKFCFVLGAGTSRDSGIKSGQELVRIWDKELRERNEEEYLRWRTEKGITDKNMSSFYSQYYEKRFWRCPADGYNFIEKIMDQASPSVGYVMLAHILTKTPHNVVITTNFDHLTENAISYYSHQIPLVIGHEVLAHYVEGQPVRSTIIKIHRDLLFDPKSEEKDLVVLPDSWKKALGRIFENYHPVFIGYAGNDKSLMDFLVENGEAFANGKWKFPYWMLYRKDKIDGKVREFLERSQGFYVEHDGFDDVMIALGERFGYVLPTEDIFLEDVKKRYVGLKDAIDAYSSRKSTKKLKEKDLQEGKTGGEEPVKQEPEKSEEQTEDQNSVTQAIDRIAGQSEEQKLFREAMALKDKGEYEQASLILEGLLENNPNNVRYLYELGRSLYMEGKYTAAEEVIKKAISIDSNDIFAYLTLGDIYLEQEDYEEAKRIYELTLEKFPTFSLAHYRFGELFCKQGQHEKALEAYRNCAAFDPTWGLPHYRISVMLVALGRNEEALEAIDKSIELDPQYKWSYYQKMRILKSLGRKEEADKVHAIFESMS